MSGSDVTTVPVELASVQKSTCSMVPVKTSLYRYVGRPAERHHYFQVTSEPPVTFAFPAAYFHWESNIKGGPQAFIALSADKNTLKPWRYTSLGECKLPLVDYDRQLEIQINSNVLGNMAAVNPEHQTLSVADLSHIGHGRIRKSGVVSGFRMFSYDEPGFHKITLNRHRVVSGVDLDEETHFGVPVRPKTSIIKFVFCGVIDRNCTVTFFYKMQTVNAYINKENIADSASVVLGIMNLIKQYDLGANQSVGRS